jgi:hypothetical protein
MEALGQSPPSPPPRPAPPPPLFESEGLSFMSSYFDIFIFVFFDCFMNVKL